MITITTLKFFFFSSNACSIKSSVISQNPVDQETKSLSTFSPHFLVRKFSFQMSQKSTIYSTVITDKHQEMDLPSQVHVEEDEEGEAAAAQEAEAERKRSPSPASTHSHLSNNKIVEVDAKKSQPQQALHQPEKVKVQARLMEKISAKTEVDETTVFPVGNEVPLYGVHSEEHNELERVSSIFDIR